VNNFGGKVSFIWSIADLLRGPYRPNQYKDVMLPLTEDVVEYMKREALPNVPDAWVDETKTKVGYEINFNRYFYKYTPPRPLAEIEADLKKIEKEIADVLAEVTE